MKKALYISCILAVILSGIGSSYAADVLIKCGGSQGYTYFVEGGLVSSVDAGWQKDAIKKGAYTLTKEGESYDLIFSDAMGRTVSSRRDGGNVVPISLSERSLVFSIDYPGKLFETWIFDMTATGTGVVTFHQARYGNFPIRKHAVMRAPCVALSDKWTS